MPASADQATDQPSRYGARPKDWAAGKRIAKVDLLPVVSNPHAKKGDRCKIKSPGKTPSQYIELHGEKLMVGFKNWTDWETNVQNIEAWQMEPDYGICIQTKEVRALDIDLPGVQDCDRAEEIFRRVLDERGCEVGQLPVRARRSSPRRILAFVVTGLPEGRRGYLKRGSFRTPTGLVEFLGTGQQFVAAGTHPSGDRYEWVGGWPQKWPEFDLEDVKAAFLAIYEELGVEGTLRGFGESRHGGTLPEDLEVEDPVAEHLLKHWPTYHSEGGKLFIDCPWKAGHSGDSGETETAWLLAGTGKYRNGHLSCLHASCASRTRDEFCRAVAYREAKAEDFEDESSPEERELAQAYEQVASAKAKVQNLPDPRGKLPLPGFLRHQSGKLAGQILTTLENVLLGLKNPQACGFWLAWDDFTAALMIAEQPEQWRPFTDADAVELRIRLERLGFERAINREMMRDALVRLSAEQRMDSAIKWLTELVPQWDGTARLHRFWPDYMNTEDTPYTRWLGLYTWTAQIGRILDPGCQVDMVPVLISPEGYRKTTALRTLAPIPDLYNSFRLEMKDEDIARLMRGCVVGELEELRGVAAREGEAVKAWVTRRVERWTPKYQERPTEFARRLVLYGTTNDDSFLAAHIGERRWLPVRILRKIDVRKIQHDLLQLWAEARAIYDLEGVMWEQVERLARAEREEFKPVDAWQEKVAGWLDGEDDVGSGVTPRSCGRLTAERVLTEALGIGPERIKRADQQRIGEVLKACGMARDRRKVNGQPVRVWIDTRTGDGIGAATAKRLAGGRR
jgi:predicted P-loop ATPase